MKVNYKGKELNVCGFWMLEFLVCKTGRPHDIFYDDYTNQASVLFLDTGMVVDVDFDSSDGRVVVHDIGAFIALLPSRFKMDLGELIERLTLTEDEYWEQFE